MVDVGSIRARYEQVVAFLDERGRRLFAATEAVSVGVGGVTAVSRATGIARSTINRGIAELKAGCHEIGGRVRRAGGGRKPAVERQPGLLAALEALIDHAIRGDPEAPLRWVSRSQRNIAEALRHQGFAASQKLVGVLLRELEYSCQANRKTREGTGHPDRNAQFEHINATVKTAIAAAAPAISVDTKKCWSATSRTPARSCVPRASPSRFACMTSRSRSSARSRPMAFTTSPPTRAGSTSASTPTRRPSRSRAFAAGGIASAKHAIPRQAPSSLPPIAAAATATGCAFGSARSSVSPTRPAWPSPSPICRPAPANGTRSSTASSPTSPRTGGASPSSAPSSSPQPRPIPASSSPATSTPTATPKASPSPTPRWPRSTSSSTHSTENGTTLSVPSNDLRDAIISRQILRTHDRRYRQAIDAQEADIAAGLSEGVFGRGDLRGVPLRTTTFPGHQAQGRARLAGAAPRAGA